MDRLQKIIAQAGICSRRKAEVLIQEGRVTVNGRSVRKLGTRVDLSRDYVRVNGKPVQLPRGRIYFLMNKPKGTVCTLVDPEGRLRVVDLIKRSSSRVFPVGRLDFNTEGLLLLTNDGDFANFISSAGEHCPKTYIAKVKGNPSQSVLKKISSGFYLEGRKLAPCRIGLIRRGENSWLRITLIEGKNNQIRKIFDQLGHSVIKLRRIQIGFLKDARLKPGEYRSLSQQEVKRFMDSAISLEKRSLDEKFSNIN